MASCAWFDIEQMRSGHATRNELVEGIRNSALKNVRR
jgi:hypothetical protein